MEIRVNQKFKLGFIHINNVWVNLKDDEERKNIKPLFRTTRHSDTLEIKPNLGLILQLEILKGCCRISNNGDGSFIVSDVTADTIILCLEFASLSHDGVLCIAKKLYKSIIIEKHEETEHFEKHIVL
jgi:hypothetical protein